VIEQGESEGADHPSPLGEGGLGRGSARAGWGSPPGKKSRLAATVPIPVARILRQRMTPQEVKLWVKLRALRPAGLHFRRQVPIAAFVVDFACLKHRLIIEVDGGQHSFDRHVASDKTRDDKLRDLGFQILRFWNAEVDADLDSIVETILAHIGPVLDPTPALRARPSPEGEG
jgi:very-short-patch-repair endonuclease